MFTSTAHCEASGSEEVQAVYCLVKGVLLTCRNHSPTAWTWILLGLDFEALQMARAGFHDVRNAFINLPTRIFLPLLGLALLMMSPPISQIHRPSSPIIDLFVCRPVEVGDPHDEAGLRR